ncbi:hypothetical protein OESDEN_20113 [Oesophagostomum dentatum]|uniref:Uncharacterized protein n=1 Tax=Oesophagostomum dentatum TaxID=61180 RepID=A0A0B1SAI8_OESDE|nr:hypothetical protein OESDEN_20113 [Oesophagostomum dentatum]
MYTARLPGLKLLLRILKNTFQMFAMRDPILQEPFRMAKLEAVFRVLEKSTSNPNPTLQTALIEL